MINNVTTSFHPTYSMAEDANKDKIIKMEENVTNTGKKEKLVIKE